MRKLAIAGMAMLTIAGSTAVYAQYRPWLREHMQHTRMSAEDRAAFADARIAAVHAGLKLTPDQEKLWPPLESAVRDFVKMRIDRANARMKSMDDGQNQGQQGQGQQGQAQAQPKDDPVTRLRERADNMGATAAALKKIADAADPLYKTLDDAQKRRLSVLTHEGRFFGGGEGGWRHRWMERGLDRDRDHDWDRHRDHDQDRDGDHDGRGERL
jgi:LTXXQ motif family protein